MQNILFLVYKSFLSFLLNAKTNLCFDSVILGFIKNPIVKVETIKYLRLDYKILTRIMYLFHVGIYFFCNTPYNGGTSIIL